jgi:hypothetical protein
MSAPSTTLTPAQQTEIAIDALSTEVLAHFNHTALRPPMQLFDDDGTFRDGGFCRCACCVTLQQFLLSHRLRDRIHRATEDSDAETIARGELPASQTVPPPSSSSSSSLPLYTRPGLDQCAAGVSSTPPHPTRSERDEELDPLSEGILLNSIAENDARPTRQSSKHDEALDPRSQDSLFDSIAENDAKRKR